MLPVTWRLVSKNQHKILHNICPEVLSILDKCHCQVAQGSLRTNQIIISLPVQWVPEAISIQFTADGWALPGIQLNTP
jgi:hypothetical protein